jgi:adenine deaminase
MSRQLVDCAMGRASADLVIRNGVWVCVQSGEFVPATDVAIVGSRIAYVGPDAGHTLGPKTRVVDAGGRHLVPGLLDGHMHVESGMVTVTEFVRAVAPHGTTGMFIDPHEMANVLGLPGVALMAAEARIQPINVWVQIPSCVTSAPGLETPGASLGPEEVRQAIRLPGVIGLGEMMNFPGVIANDPKMHAEMSAAMNAGKVVGGHYASADLGRAFHAYAAGGPADDHEGTQLADAVMRVRQGMKHMLRYGSAAFDVADPVRALTEMGLDSRHFILVTDDCHSGTLVGEGHLDRAVRHAIAQGVSPMTAIQLCTLNTAEHFGLARDIGQIAPGRYADLLLVDDLAAMRPGLVVSAGEVICEDGAWVVDLPKFEYPAQVKRSVKIGRPVAAGDFQIPAPAGQTRVRARVIGVVENQMPTRSLELDLPAQAGWVQIDLAQDVCKVGLVERHQGTGRIQVGLVHGFGFRGACAVASTVAHDSHHMLVVGSDEAAMATAANALAERQGGMLVVKGESVIAAIEMPIAGLMSEEPCDVVAAKAGRVLDAFRACGCTMNNANIQVSFLALIVIPELRISDLGLVDVTKFERVPVLI